MLSKCCQAHLTVGESDEGTCCYVCSKCNKPSDPFYNMEIDRLREKIMVFANDLSEFHTGNTVSLKKQILEDLIDDLIIISKNL